MGRPVFPSARAVQKARMFDALDADPRFNDQEDVFADNRHSLLRNSFVCPVCREDEWLTDARVQQLIGILAPIYAKQGKQTLSGLTPSDIVTNEFIDPSISLKS